MTGIRKPAATCSFFVAAATFAWLLHRSSVDIQIEQCFCCIVCLSFLGRCVPYCHRRRFALRSLYGCGFEPHRWLAATNFCARTFFQDAQSWFATGLK